MHILITGGTGLIGSAFINSQPSYQYTLLTRQTLSNCPDNWHCIAKLAELENLDAFDVVINLAGEPIIDNFWGAKQKKVIQQSRWQTTQD